MQNDNKNPASMAEDAKGASQSSCSKGRKPKHRKGGKPYGRDSKGDSRIAVNSPEFWNRVPGLLGAAGRLPSTYPMGGLYDGFGQKMISSREANQVLRIGWIPSLGQCKGEVLDPANTAAQQVFTAVREAISGSRPYDPSDLYMYIVAVYNIHLYIDYLKLIYGCTNVVSPLNRDFARIVAYGLGVDYDDIVKNKSNLLFYINNLVYRVQQFAVPGDMSLIKHWKLLVSGVFSDRFVDTIKNQFFLLVPSSFYYYDWENVRLILKAPDDETFIGAGLELSYDSLLAFGNGLINAMSNNTDVGIMSGDILKTFSGSLLTQEVIDAGYTMKLNITSNEMLNQIRNMNFFDAPDEDELGRLAIKQRNGSIMAYASWVDNDTKPVLTYVTTDTAATVLNAAGVASTNSKGQVLIAFEDHLSEDAIMVATRMMVNIDFSEALFDPERQKVQYGIDAWGVELFFRPTFIRTYQDAIQSFAWATQCYFVNDLTSSDLGDIISARSEFEGAPKLFRYTVSAPGSTGAALVGTGEDHYALENFTLVPTVVLADLHYAAVQSAVYVPKAGNQLKR